MNAWVHEVVDDERWPAVVLTGRFRCHVKDGREAVFDALEPAIAWARERADEVYLDFEDRGYDVTRDLPPAAVRDRAALGRRRLPGQEWLDRTLQDPPIEWIVDVQVHPAGLHASGPDRERQDAVAAVAERALLDAGFTGVRMSAAGLDAGLADIDAQGEGQEGEYGWTTAHSLAYEIGAGAVGRTRDEVIDHAVEAAAGALERELGEPVWRHSTEEHDAWGVTAGARPAGAEPLVTVT